MPSFPFTPALPHLVDLLEVMLASPVTALDDDAFERDWRDQCAHAVLLLPATCSEARDLVKLDELRWAWLCAFEQFRLGVPRGAFRFHDVHMLDGLPSCINDIHLRRAGTRSIHDPHKDCTLIEPMADGPHFCVMIWTAFAMRVARDTHLQNAVPNSADLKEHTHGLVAVDGMPENLPLRVRVFAGFLRWTAQYAMHNEGDDGLPHSVLRPCSRNRCARPAHAEPAESWTGFPFARLVVHENRDDDKQLGEYWKTAHKCATDSRAPASYSELRFCSSVCAMQTWQEYDRCIRCATFEELSAAPSASRRAASVTRMYREALDRNATISRRMRADKGEPSLRHWDERAFPHTVRAEREHWIRSLNIDTAMLYAASFLAELGQGRRSKKAMPSAPEWRLGASRWFSALWRLARLMRGREHGQPTLAVNYFSPPSWFRAVKDAALTRVF